MQRLGLFLNQGVGCLYGHISITRIAYWWLIPVCDTDGPVYIDNPNTSETLFKERIALNISSSNLTKPVIPTGLINLYQIELVSSFEIR